MSSIWLTVIVQRCRSFRTSWKRSDSLSLSLSHLYRTGIWVKLSVACYQHTAEIDKQLIRCHRASVNVSCYWVFLYLCSLSLLILNESDGPHSYHLSLLSLSPSLSLSLSLSRSSMSLTALTHTTFLYSLSLPLSLSLSLSLSLDPQWVWRPSLIPPSSTLLLCLSPSLSPFPCMFPSQIAM